MMMFPSACTWLFKTPVVKALHAIKETAFHYVDLELEMLDDPVVLETVRELGLKVSCVALDHRLPSGCSLEGNDERALRQAVAYLQQGFKKCQEVGATVAYVTSCRDRRNVNNFGRALQELSEEAGRFGIKLCVEHVPGRALATARETLVFVADGDKDNLFLLLDTGHALITREESHEIISSAGGRLGYVQLDDNDGKNDKHWALLDGLMRYEELLKCLEALQKIGYEGTLGLELGSDRASGIGGLSRNRNLILRMQMQEEPKSLKEPETRRLK